MKLPITCHILHERDSFSVNLHEGGRRASRDAIYLDAIFACAGLIIIDSVDGNGPSTCLNFPTKDVSRFRKLSFKVNDQKPRTPYLSFPSSL